MIIPVAHRVIVKPIDVMEDDEAYKAAKRLGLDLSMENKLKREQDAVDRGIVVSFGPTVFADFGTENPLKIGDEIVYARHAGKKVEDGETDYLVLNDEDVICIIKKDAKDE